MFPDPLLVGASTDVIWSLLDALSTVSDPLVLLSIVLFLGSAAATAANRRDLLADGQRLAVYAGGAAWATFGIFWLSMFPYFYLEFQSPLESVLSLVGVPLCLYTGYLLVTKRESLLLLTRAVGFMGLLYLPAMLIPAVQGFLIETVATQAAWMMDLVGYGPRIVEAPNGYMSKFDMEHHSGEQYATYVVLSCTGIGSIAIFGGLIAAARASLRTKVFGFAITATVIWVLNIGRNAFVALAATLAWFDTPALESVTVALAGEGMRTSFFVSHHLLSQSLSVVALVVLTFFVVKLVPDTISAVEELLYVLTGDDYDLAAAVGIDPEEPTPATPADD